VLDAERARLKFQSLAEETMSDRRLSSFRVGIMIFGIIIAISVLGIVLYLNKAGDVSSVDDDAGGTLVHISEEREGAKTEVPNTSQIQRASNFDNSETDTVVIAEAPEQEVAAEAPLTKLLADRKAGEDVTPPNNHPDIDDLSPVIKEFKANPGFREGSAKKLLPRLTKGMAADAVAELLGAPTDKDDRVWRYSVFYSKAIEVYFDEKGVVTEIIPVGIEDDQLEKSQD
jgi:hypothetical protein